MASLRRESALILGILMTLIAYGPASYLFVGISDYLLFGILFVLIFVIMMALSFTAVRHADHLAALLGEPYGTLILTLAVITIEVALISAIMLSGDAAPTLARDTMMAVLMIVLNGVVGIVLLVGGFRHWEQTFNLRGANAYLTVLVTLATMSLIMPKFTISTPDYSLTETQSLLFGTITIILYATFLAIQTSRHRAFFVEPQPEKTLTSEETSDHHLSEPSKSVAFHAILLVCTLVPAVLLSKKVAVLLDFGIETWSLPVAVGGLLIACLVLAPEALAAINSARDNHLQRAVNICLGSALATIGMTVPAALAISILIHHPIQLGVSNTDLALLFLTMFVSVLTFSSGRTNMLQGAVHLVIFLVYIVLIFDA